jgi:hypothetical protein
MSTIHRRSLLVPLYGECVRCWYIWTQMSENVWVWTLSLHLPDIRKRILTDLVNALPGNCSVNSVQHATIVEAVFSVDPTDALIYRLNSDHVTCVYSISMSVPRLYNESSELLSSERIGTRNREEYKRSACEDFTWLQPPAHAGSSPADFSTLKMEAIRSSETSVQFTRSTRPHVTEDGILHSHRLQNLTSYTMCHTTARSVRALFISRRTKVVMYYTWRMCTLLFSKIWHSAVW